MDEIALLDLPSMFRRILSYSPVNSKIIFIGHSLGSTVSLMYTAEYPEHSKNVLKMQIFLCPAYTLTNMVSPFKSAAAGGDLVYVSKKKNNLLKYYFLLRAGKNL